MTAQHHTAAWTDRVVEHVLMDVCELPDRSSPDDWPEAMLVTGEELNWIVRAAIAKATGEAGQ